MSRCAPTLPPPRGACSHGPPWFRALARPGPLASGLLCLGLTLSAGCVLGQVDDMELPPLKNRRVRIIDEQAIVMQSATREFRWGTRPNSKGLECKLEFQAPVEDPDLDDQLIARWYVDYEQNGRGPVEETFLENNGTPERLAKFEVNTDAPGNPFFEPGRRVLTLLVTDARTAKPGEPPRPDPVPGYDAGNPRYSDTLDWVINIDDGCCVPGCEDR
jgi:hypothetical protein